MPHRDPVTGQFTGETDVASLLGQDDVDIEYLTYAREYRVGDLDGVSASASLGGDFNVFDGDELVNFRTALDRNQAAMVVGHNAYVQTAAVAPNSDEDNGDQAYASAAFEWSTDSEATVAQPPGSVGSITPGTLRNDPSGTAPNIQRRNGFATDSVDLLHEPAVVTMTQGKSASDGSGTALAGGPFFGKAEVSGPMAPEDWVLDDRDDLYINGSFSVNNGTTALLAEVVGQLAYLEMDEDTAVDLLIDR